MKSGLILILAAILVLATSAVIDLPVDGSGERGGIDISRWPAYRLKWNQDSPYLNKFSVKGNVVKKTSKDERFQILLTALPCFAKTKVSFRVNSYGGKEHGLFIGLITEKRLFEKESQGVYDDTCALYTTPKEEQGNIYMNGNELEAWSEDWYVPEGSILDVETDLSSGYVTFYNRGSSTTRRVALSNSFYGVNVYLFVNAHHTNASFELL
jgi:hypothetical protein